MRAVTLASLVTAVWPAPAAAHVQPSVDANNRYLKLTPMGDRIRLAYTVLLGQKPGAAERLVLDRDHDGELDDDEARRFGQEIAGRVHPAVTVLVDGRPTPVAWATVDVGLGSPEVAAGALSVDLIGWICVSGGGEHRLVLRDTLTLDHPGDTELRLEESPGVELGERRLGGDRMSELDAAWTGSEGPLVGAGLEMSWTAGDEAVRPADGRCHDPRATPRRRWWAWGVAAVGGVLAMIAGFAISRRARARARGGQGR